MKKIKTVLSLVIVFSMLCCYPVYSNADADIIKSGSCGSNARYTIYSDGRFVISGRGAMTDYSESAKVPWRENWNDIKSVSIEDGITNISNYAFSTCRNLESADLPDSITVIGIHSFYNCSGLEQLDLPYNLERIGESAFYGCSGLTDIVVPPCNCGRWAFADCTGLEDATVLYGPTYMAEGMFSGCTGLTSVSIPSSVTEIRKTALSGCTNLESVRIPKTVQSFGWGAFGGSGIKSIIIPDGVETISDWMFNGCDNLLAVTIPDSVKRINSRAFYECTSLTDAYYAGSESQWNGIIIDNTWNDEGSGYNQPIINAKIHYGYEDESEDPLHPVIWNWDIDNYSFTNNASYFGPKGSPIYIDNNDFTSFLATRNNTDIAQMASWYGYGSKYTPQVKLYNFLTNHLDTWGGSCYGMSLTAALFNAGIKDPSAFGGNDTHSIPALKKNTNSRLESFINIYHISQACGAAFNSGKLYSINESQFPAFMNNYFNKAATIDKAENMIVVIMEALTNDNKCTKGHAVLCYGGERGSWSINGRECDRRLLIADPNKSGETYIYISIDSSYATYSGDPDYNAFGYYDCSLNALNAYDYNESLINMEYNIIMSTRNGAVLVGRNPYCKAIIKDGKITIDPNSSADFFIKVVNKMSDSEGDSEEFYCVSGSSAQYEVRPLEGEELDAALYFDNYGVNVQGDIGSATINSGDISLNQAAGDVALGLISNDSNIDFATVSGTADGNVQVELEKNQIAIKGDLSNYTVSNMDRDANKVETTVNGDTDSIITVDGDNNIEVTDDSTSTPCDHSWDSSTITTKASCETAGVKTFICTKGCGTVKTETIPATGHKYSAWKTTKKATEIAAGQKTHTCSVCKHVEKATIKQLKPTLPAITIAKPVAAKKSAIIKWKNVSNKNQKKIASIQIQYSLDKKFKRGVKTTTAKKTATSKKISKLTSKKTYYMRIRSYKKDKKGVHVSKWSATKAVKVK